MEKEEIELILFYLNPKCNYIDISGEEFQAFADAVFHLLCEYSADEYIERKRTNEKGGTQT